MAIVSIVGRVAALACLSQIAIAQSEFTQQTKTYNGANLTLLHNISTSDVTHELALPEHSNGPNETDGSYPFLIFATKVDQTLWMTDGENVTSLAVWDRWLDTEHSPDHVHWFNDLMYIAVGSNLYATNGGEYGAVKVMQNDDAEGFWIENFLTFNESMYFSINSTLFRFNAPKDYQIIETFPNAISGVAAGNGYILVTLNAEYVLDENDEWQHDKTNVYATDGSVSGATLLTSEAFGASLRPHDRNPILEDGNVLISAENGLWRTLGTPESTVNFFDQGGMKFGVDFLFSDGSAHTGMGRFSFTTKGTAESTQPLISCQEGLMPPDTTCLNVEESAGITGFGEAGAYHGQVGTGPPIDGRLMIMSIGAGSGTDNDMDVFMSDGVVTEKIASLPDFVPWQGNRLSDNRLVVFGYKMNSEPGIFQIWILDGTVEGSMLLAEFMGFNFDKYCGILESMSKDFALVNTCSSLYRLDIPPKPEIFSEDSAEGEDKDVVGTTQDEPTLSPVAGEQPSTLTLSPSVDAPVTSQTEEEKIDDEGEGEPDIPVDGATSNRGGLTSSFSGMYSYQFWVVTFFVLFTYF